jgi:LacI family transcriptional regulator
MAGSRWRGPTIHDVAREAGVSIATVSRALNGYQDASAATAERVREVARSLGYSASVPAQALRQGTATVVGVVYNGARENPMLQHPFFAGVLQGFAAAVGAAGFDILLPAAAEADGDRRFLEQSRRHRLAGVVVLAHGDDAEVRRLAEAGLPVVGVDTGRGLSGVGCVTSANAEGAALAVRHLHERGHVRIATLAGPEEPTAAEDRLRGYLDTLAELGLEQRPEWIVHGDFDRASGREGAASLLALAEPPTAVFATSDVAAAGLLDVTTDLAVVGFDDLDFARDTTPPLTTIRQDRERLGAAAAELLVELVERGESAARTISIPVELVVRESSRAAQG